MTLSEPLGWFAARLVFAAFCAQEMAPLRAIAIANDRRDVAAPFGRSLRTTSEFTRDARPNV
ncbi:MAG TPA: hypothetical protein VN900_06200 [Stellaceae bacterium]|jgi:hypothetical protein|nr:hypothetical protein [Stellaceae bacterium]